MYSRNILHYVYVYEPIMVYWYWSSDSSINIIKVSFVIIPLCIIYTYLRTYIRRAVLPFNLNKGIFGLVVYQ